VRDRSWRGPQGALGGGADHRAVQGVHGLAEHLGGVVGANSRTWAGTWPGRVTAVTCSPKQTVAAVA